MNKDQRSALSPVLDMKLHSRLYHDVSGHVRHSYHLLVLTGGLKGLSVH